MGQIIFYVSAGVIFGAVGFFVILLGLKRRGTYTGLTIDDMIESFRQVNQESLQGRLADIVAESAVEPHQGWASYVYRRHLRLALDALKEYIERMLHNSVRLGYWAAVDEHEMKKHKLEYTPQSLKALGELLEADAELHKLARFVLFRLSLWSLTGFEERTWGPLPDVQRFSVDKLLEGYNRVKRAAEAYALFYGDTGKLIAEEIGARM